MEIVHAWFGEGRMKKGRIIGTSSAAYSTILGLLEEEKRPARTRREEGARLARRAQKLDRYQQVLERA
jgi:hypothetical protein